MASWNSFTVYNSNSSSILSHIKLNAVKFADDGGRLREVYFGIGFSKLDRPDVWYLLSGATKSLMFKLKVKKKKLKKSTCYF